VTTGIIQKNLGNTKYQGEKQNEAESSSIGSGRGASCSADRAG